MARTTPALVKGILLADYKTTTQPDLTPFIDTASAIVDDVVACATADAAPISSDRAELIERWLAAHYYKCSDQQLSEKRTADSAGKYAGRTDKGLEGTKYGQTALQLDPSGCLLSVVSSERASMVWLGKPVSEQTSYGDRN